MGAFNKSKQKADFQPEKKGILKLQMICKLQLKTNFPLKYELKGTTSKLSTKAKKRIDSNVFYR